MFDEENRVILALDLNKLLVPLSATDSAAYVSYSNKPVVNSWASSFSGAGQLQQIRASIGLEYWYKALVGIRGGYFYEDRSNGGRSYLSAGASVKYLAISAHFAYLATTGSRANNHPLDNSLLFGLIYHF